jgi:hexosaminidase
MTKMRTTIVRFLLLAGMLAGITPAALTGTFPRPVYLVPAPKQLTVTEGICSVSREMPVKVVGTRDSADFFSASLVKAELGAVPPGRKGSVQKRGTIEIGRIGGSTHLERKILGVSPTVFDSIGTEGYVLQTTPRGAVIAGRTSAGIFYGIQTLNQLLRANRLTDSLPCVTIVDWPALRYRGVMLDISRGPIPTMDFLKNIVSSLAEYKLNCFTLYTEHVFKLSAYPDIAPQDGITAEQVKELAGFGAKYHIELIGNAQSFGHMENMLAIPFYRAMAENSSVVSPAVDETYRFLKDAYAEIVPAYSSPLFHINCDEVGGLGSGPARRLVDSLGTAEVYANHINRIADIIRPYGKRVMMWGDIAAENPDIVKRLPKDLIVISWGYDGADSFVNAIMPFKKTGFDFMVSPGVSCWGQVWPNMSNAVTNISNYVRDGAALGTLGVLNTIWVDDGENLFNYNWQGVLWGAECSWNPARTMSGNEAKAEIEIRNSVFNDAFDNVFFGMSNASAAFYLFDTLRTFPIRGFMTDQGVWSSPLEIYPTDVDVRTASATESAMMLAGGMRDRFHEMRKYVTRHTEVVDAAAFASDRAFFTLKKNNARIAIDQARRAPTADNIGRARLFLKNLASDLHTLKNGYIRLWELENRSWWRDRVLAKYDKLGAELIDLDKSVSIEGDSLDATGRRLIRCSTVFGDQEIHYTTDGSEPTLRSPVYTVPMTIDRSSLVRARVITGGLSYPVAEKHFLVHRAAGKPSQLRSTYSSYNPAYAAGGPGALVDGIRGSERFSDGRWQGFQGQDVEIVIDLQTSTEIKSISSGFLQNSYSWILMPSKVEYWVSRDGRDFTLAGEVRNAIDAKAEGTVVHDFTKTFDGLRARYVKVIGKNPGKLPAWHHAAGNDSFMFADEVVVE